MSVTSCLLNHMGAKSPIAAYRKDMADDVAELVADGMTTEAAWLKVAGDKLAELKAERARIEQVVADAYAKTPAGKPAEGDAPQVKVYKLRANAEKAKKEAGNTLRIRKVSGGYILREATDKELAAAEKAGRRLAQAARAVDVENDSLLTAIAKLGGIAMSERKDTIGSGNRNIGGKMLFTAGGKPIDLLADEDLRDLGYVPQSEVDRDGGGTWLRSAIAAEYMGTQQHFSERGTEWMEDAMRQREAAMDDPFDDVLADFTPDELGEAGYTAADPAVQQATEELLAAAEAAGIDTEALREDAARLTADQPEDAYHAEVQRLARNAIAELGRNAQVADAGAAQASAEDRGESAGDQGQEGLTLEAQTADDLRAKTGRETAAQQADAADQKRLADKAKADAQRDEFVLTGSNRPADVAAAAGQKDIFSANEPEAAQPDAERFAAGRALTKEQRKQVLGTLVDVYKAKGAPREFKGVGRDGNERSGYVHSPELFEKSDITGAMVRYYVTLPDKRIAHPSELFPDYTQSDIEAAISKQEHDERVDREEQARWTDQADRFGKPTAAEADAAWMERNGRAGGNPLQDWRTGERYTLVPMQKGGKFYSVRSDDAALIARLERGGWAQPEAKAEPTSQPLAEALPKPWTLTQDEFAKRAQYLRNGNASNPWTANWGDAVLEGGAEEFDHPDLGKTVVQGGRFFKTKREAEVVARGAHKRAVRRALLNGEAVADRVLDGYADLKAQVENDAARAQPVAQAEPADTLNKRHSIPKAQVLTPAGSIRAAATDSKAPSSLWYYQGDMGRLQFTASVTIDGKPDPGADQAKAMLEKIKSVQDAGWRRTNYRAGSMGTVWVFEKDGKFLTRAGMENADAAEIQRPELSPNKPGFLSMATQQFELAKAFNDWLQTLPEDQQQNRGVVVRKMGETPVGKWARVEDDPNGEVTLLYYDEGATQFRIRISAKTWPEMVRYVAGLAERFEQSKTADEYAIGVLQREAGAEAAPKTLKAKVDDRRKPAEPATSRFEAAKDIMRAIYDGTAGVDEYRAGYRAVVDNADEVRAELNKLTKDDLIRTFGIMRDGKKDELVGIAYESLVRGFALGKEYGPTSYGMTRGGHENYKKLKAEALTALVEGQTADDLAAYAAEVKQEREARASRLTALKESIQDPKTLEDFRRFMDYHQRDGKTYSQARMMLTPEQRAAYDDLSATASRGQRKTATDTERTQVRVAGQTVDGEIIATKHTKKGTDLYVVKLAERVSREDYDTLNAGAKRIGGYYSSFRGAGAVPGFQFTTRDQAEAFVKLAGGDKTDAVAAAQERRDAFADDRSQSAAERLTEMADRLDERADESLGRERQVNTERRARFAASAEASAQADKAMATTMRNIAKAMTDGSAKFLDRVRQKTQVEMLQAYVRTAKDAELRAKHDSYAEQQKHQGEPPTGETADFAEFPSYTAFRSDLASLGRQLLEVDGTKLLGQRMMKVADDVSDAFTAFAKEPGNQFKLSTFSTSSGQRPTFPTSDVAERAIARSGHKGKAIAWQVKRGEWTVIMSPSEAMARGIWQGDGDKRITLSNEFGAELVEKIGRANRRGAKVSVPWQFETAHDRLKTLARMGIETAPEFRAALREFIGMRAQAAAPDKVKQMERAMVDRRNDGLDFFPTPEGVADEMVAAAGIEPGMRVLEPSAGMGHIAERIREAGVEPDVGEVSSDRRELLEAKGFDVVGRDFMEMQEGGYDRILMNPPFSDGRDIQHVRHAYDMLKPGGRLVAIMGESAFTNQNKRATEFREWLESVGGTEEKLPEGTFNDPSLPVNTGANARMVVIEKGEAGSTKLDATSLDRGYTAPDTSAYEPAGNADTEAVDRLAARLNRGRPRERHVVLDAVAPRAGATGPRAREIAAVASVAKRLFGHRVVFVKFQGAPLFNGAVDSENSPGVIFIRADAQRPMLAVLGHELLHQLRDSSPDIYREFVRRISRVTKNAADYAENIEAAYKEHGREIPKEWVEEMHADIVGDNFTDPQFWQDMAADQPGLFKRLANAILKFLDDVAESLRGVRSFGTERYLTDIGAARAAVVNAMRDFSGRSVAQADNASEGIRLSIAHTLQEHVERVRGLDQQKVRNAFADMVGSAGAKVSWWDKHLGTQYAKAEKLPAYKRVFERVQSYIEDVSTLANQAADQAPLILPKLETWKDLKRSFQQFGLKKADAEAVAAPVFQGTLAWSRDEDGKPVKQDDIGKAGIVWTDAELRERFDLKPEQIKAYRQFRNAVDTSLDQVVAADVLKLLGDKNPALRELALADRDSMRSGIDAYLTEQAEQGDTEAEQLRKDIREKYEKIDKLKEEGYAPLMRFGQYKVYVSDPETGESLFFGLYESKAAANAMARDLAADPEFKDATIEQGVLSQEQYKLFNSVPVESLEMFADAIGAEKSEVFQAYLRLAKNNRSALKRLIHRKGTAGFSEDVPRVLASFITSNSRLASGAMNLTAAKNAIEDIRDGDVKDEAIQLVDSVQNPKETASAARGLMFANFIGGSIASAAVNLTQPVTMTLPYLSQFGGIGKATARLMSAAKMAATSKVDDAELQAALKKAEDDGTVAPQEIHHLTAQAMGSWGNNAVSKRAAFIWGAPFSLAEQFNRRTSFIAAYKTAQAEGIEDPFAFAERAVVETQGLYNKGNMPNLSRSALGATAMQFKQYSIHYLEWMKRMWNAGEPGSDERRAGRRAVLIALALLMAAAGTDGLPFADDIDDLVDTIGQALGYNTNSKKARRDLIANTLGLGDETADAVARGLSALPGVPMDVSLRMGMGNLIPASGLFLRSNTDRSRDLLELAGPAGGMAKQYMDAAQKGLGGDVSGALAGLAPVAIQNAMKALDMWQTGEARDTMGRKVMEADEVDGLMKFLGFNPAPIARESQKMGMIRRSEQLAKNVEGEIAGKWARAFADGDTDGVRDARQEMADWNERNPEDRISITSGQIVQRVKKLRQDRAQRFITSVSPERRRAVAAELEQ